MDGQDEGFWHSTAGPPLAADLLQLLRRYGEAERSMRSETRQRMGMGENDLRALRYIIDAHRCGQLPRQRDLAAFLGISAASASALIDRLCDSGHAERVAHPEDRRSSGIVPTHHASNTVRRNLGGLHQRMMAAVESLDSDEKWAVRKFLLAMTQAVEAEDRNTA